MVYCESGVKTSCTCVRCMLCLIFVDLWNYSLILVLKISKSTVCPLAEEVTRQLGKHMSLDLMRDFCRVTSWYLLSRSCPVFYEADFGWHRPLRTDHDGGSKICPETLR